MKALTLVTAVAAGAVARRLMAGASRTIADNQDIEVIPSVSVVIPARNEAERIGPCVSALSDMAVDELIVVDDDSDDETALIAKRYGAIVISAGELPDGWVGKPWAMQRGLEAATGEIVIFLDADTIPQPGLIEAVAQSLNNADVVSFAPKFRTQGFVETMLHTSMLATLVYRFGPPSRKAADDRLIANGQCIAVRRTWLEDEDGFALSATHMTDDVAFVRALRARGAEIAFVDGREFLEVDMHESVGDVWNQWGRSLPMNDVSPPSHRAVDLAMLWILMVLPLVRIVIGKANALDWAVMAARTLLNAAFLPTYAHNRAGVLLSAVTDPLAVTRITQATLRPVRHWRGRTYN
jgi:dolichol-phosphate mannosyltransferase